MRKLHRRSFLLVAELKNRRIAKIIEGPDEKSLRGSGALEVTDSAVLRELAQLHRRFPLPDYDVIVARAENLQGLKNAFPEFSGWDVRPQRLTA